VAILFYMALFALLVTVPACQVIKPGHGDRKFFITTYIDSYNGKFHCHRQDKNILLSNIVS
ncbi:hypothetical protein, partial [Geobacillus kaustophilus]|uniref:hypothetical protein n=1 Tax=Geobacillus kaustophilus TaxID=1462 RepID=UPI001E2A3393